MKKSYRGIVEYSFSLYLLLFAAVLLLYVFRTEILFAASRQTEDALVSANLAAAVIDTELYDREDYAVVSDGAEAYRRYLKALKENLELGDDMVPEKNYLIKNKVTVESFEIYNVYGDEIEKLSVSEDGRCTKSSVTGDAVTPNGKPVVYTSIYSRIGFEVEGLFGQQFYVRKENCVDIAAEQSEEEENEEEENL